MAGLQLSFNNPYQVVDKAHNLFLQTWVTTGGISAILLFALFFHYLLTTFWGVVASKGEGAFTYGLRLGLLAGISGFVMSSMATDSTIGSTGVFFVLLGMGYGVNYFLKRPR
jgi:O-antigen ligase